MQELVADRQRQQTIQQAIQELPGKYRAVLTLRSLQALTYEEVAQVLSLPVGTIKTHLFQASTRLKDRLHALEQEEAAPPSSVHSTTQLPASFEEPAPSLFARLAHRFSACDQQAMGGGGRKELEPAHGRVSSHNALSLNGFV